ncbi:hypothetical protein D9M70_553620 [compost metagenome]
MKRRMKRSKVCGVWYAAAEKALAAPPTKRSRRGFSAANRIASAARAGSYSGGGRRGSTSRKFLACMASGVSRPAGLISVMLTGACSCSSSSRSESVKPLIACCEAAYALCSGSGPSEASLPMLMMAPPRSRRCAAAASEPWTVPQ